MSKNAKSKAIHGNMSITNNNTETEVNDKNLDIRKGVAIILIFLCT